MHSKELERSVVVLALVAPGKVYPVIESPNDPNGFSGKSCQPRYQSHYVVVDDYYPAQRVEPDSKDELVIFQEAQILPKFIVTLKAPSSLGGNPVEETGLSGGNQ